MPKHLPSVVLSVVVLVSLFFTPTFAQNPHQPELTSAPAWVSQLETEIRVVHDVTYLTASNTELQLDLYLPRNTSRLNPTVIYFHGGGWTTSSRQGALLRVLPYVEMGFSVVNVSYRLARVALAPAAVEDARCALRWVFRNAKQYAFDTNKVILIGHSAGGHLALTTGLLPPTSDFDRECFGTEDPKVAAIVNWYGITDVAELIDGPRVQGFAVRWLAGLPNRAELARQVSPLTYVRAGLPPILTIHGDADPAVPYTSAIRFRDALTKAGVMNEMFTVAGGGHGNFNAADNLLIYSKIRSFLIKFNLMPGT